MFTQDCVMTELRYKVESDMEEEHWLILLPTELWIEVFQFLNFSELLKLTLVDKRFNFLVGNHPFWHKICLDLKLPEPLPLIQTYKSIFAASKLGPKKCQKCGITTLRKIFAGNLLICQECQPSILITKTQAKNLYMLNDNDMITLPLFSETNSSVSRRTATFFLKSDVEDLSMSKFNGIHGVEQEILKRSSRKAKLKKTKKQIDQVSSSEVIVKS